MKIIISMKGLFIAILTLSIPQFSQSQSFEMDGSEIGVDLAFSASTVGGNFGLGLKYGINFGEYIITGPSVRYERIWSKGTNQTFTYSSNVYGGGAFLHARFFNAFFIGTEFEYLKVPFPKTTSSIVDGIGSWAPSLLVGGGFSMEFKEIVRLNAGIMYDVIDADNSPFRNSYMPKKNEFGQTIGYIPIIYRIAFFFPL